MRRYNDEQLDELVLFFLKQHIGQHNPIGRWELVVKIYGMGADYPRTDANLADRQVRQSVMRLRQKGVLVCDMGDGRGRFLAASLTEYQAFRAYFGSGVFEKMAALNEMDRAAKQEFPDLLQPKLI